MNRYTVLSGQSVEDIAVEVYGRADAALDVAVANGILPTAELVPGEVLILPDGVVEDGSNVSYYSRNGYHPATAITKEDIESAPYGGINYMGIEIDFIVS